MTADSEAGGQPESEEMAGAVLAQVYVARATELARSGSYLAAENILGGLEPKQAEVASVLDLRARMGAQQGRLEEARGLWRRALERDPTNADYAAALGQIAKLERRRTPLFLAPIAIALSILLLGLIAITSLQPEERRVGVEPSPIDIAQIESGQDSLNGRVNALEAILVRHEVAYPAPELLIGVPGVRVRRDGDETVLEFEDALFTHLAELTPDGRKTLTAVASAIESYAGRLSILVIGHTDDLQMRSHSLYPDNIALGMARAAAVITHMRTHSALPFDSFSARSLGDRDTPYPHDAASRALNRTSVIRLLPLPAPSSGRPSP